MLRPALIAAALVAALPGLATSQAAGSRADVNGMQMYYEVSGEGEPLSCCTAPT